MPAAISFLDMSASITPPTGLFVPFPVITGPNWQPNDIRVYCQMWNNWTQTPATTGCDTTWYTPPGYTSVNFEDVYSGASRPQWQWGVAWRRLQPGDTDTFVTFTRPDLMALWATALFTVRGVDPTFTPSPGTFGFAGANTDHLPHLAGTATVSSITVPAAGAVNIFMCSSPNLNINTSGGSGCALGIPTGWTNLVATGNSGLTYQPDNQGNAAIVVGKSYSTSGSTGSVNFPYANAIDTWLMGTTMFLQAAPDVSVTAGNASTTAAATNATFSVSTAVTQSTGNAGTIAAATTAFNPLYGVWLSDPLTLSGQPVTGSTVRWVQSAPAAGSTVSVQTSINNGVTWDTATNNGAIPRLLVGDTATPSVLARIILSRVNATDTAPKVSSLEVQVSADSSVDELVPVGHGMIDKVTVNAVGGTSGTGSVTNTVSSSAVISRGGGQTGGATSIKLHVTDLSGSIKRNVWAMPYTVPAGLNYGAAAKAMVLSRLPDQTAFAISSTSRVTPLLVYGLQQGGDPWQDIQDLATAIGFEAFFDAQGVFTFRPVPNPAVGNAVWAFDQTGVLLVSEATRELSNDQTFNNIVVIGQTTSSSNPVTAQAFDNNPSSPTYILGPFGQKTERLTFSTIITQDQAQAAANALLYNSLGGADTVTLTVVPQPALEPGDIVKVNVSDVDATGNYMINSMTTSLSPADPQQLVCFRQSTS